MKITPEVIETKEFKVKMKGYDKREVDVFLDEITEEFEITLNIVNKLKEEKDILLNQLAHYKKIENQLNETFFKAQESADQIMAEAIKNCEEKKAQADAYLREINEDKYNQVSMLDKKYNDLKAKYLAYRNSIKMDLRKQLEILEDDTLD